MKNPAASSEPANIVSDRPLLQPHPCPLLINRFNSTSDAIRLNRPLISSFCCCAPALRLSGVPRSSSSATSATAMEKTKIQRQPRPVAMAPPTNEHSPLPPHEPITQKLTARWRALPSYQVLINARVAGMMQAADSPCKTRPARNSQGPWARISSALPAILNPKPIWVMRIRPNLSASPPLATTKQPLKSALRLTASVSVSREISRLFFIAGTTLITDWANSQKVSTLSTMPASRRSVPTNGVSVRDTELIECLRDTSSF